MSIHETNSNKIGSHSSKTESTPKAETKAASQRLQSGSSDVKSQSHSHNDHIDVDHDIKGEGKQFNFDFGHADKEEIKKAIRLPQRPSKQGSVHTLPAHPDDATHIEAGPLRPNDPNLTKIEAGPLRPENNDHIGLYPGDKDPGIMPHKPFPDDKGRGHHLPFPDDKGRPSNDDGPGLFPGDEDPGIMPHKPFPDDKGPSHCHPFPHPHQGPGLFPGDKDPGIMPQPKIVPPANNLDIDKIEPNQPDCWTERHQTPQIEPNQPGTWSSQPVVPPGIQPL